VLRIRIPEAKLEQAINQSIEALKRGGIIAYPTETFYGLGVIFDKEDSLRRLYEIKQRPKEKAMPLIIGNKELLLLLTKTINPRAFLLMERFWPGPLTLILPAKEYISSYLTAGTDRVAVRIPGESFALHLARKANFPFTATSANLSGTPPAKDAEEVTRYFRDAIDLLIDKGPTPGGLPSTIIDATGEKMKILREGAVSRESLEEFLKRKHLRFR